MTTETTTEHKHAFPCNPPGGTFLRPGPCECGKTAEQSEADLLLTMALEGVERAYGVPPRISEDWAVAYGSDSLNDGRGCVSPYDDEEDAREHLGWYRAGSQVVRRTVIALRWEAAPGELPEPAAAPSCTNCGPDCACGGCPREGM